MYKKQLTLTIATYLAILFLFTACNLTDSPDESQTGPITPVIEVVEVAETAETEKEAEQQTNAELEQTSIEIAEPEREEANTSADMGSSNNMMGGNTAEIPIITYFPTADIDLEGGQQALEILVQEKAIAMLLAGRDEWHVEMWFNEEEMLFEIDLFDTDWEWISWGAVSLLENAVVEVYTPQPLTAEEYQVQQTQAQTVVLANPEVLAILGDPAEWEQDAWYNEWEASWDVVFYKALDEINVRVDTYDGEMAVSSIENLALLTEEQQVIDNQNQAIELAWGAEGVDEAIYNTDAEWQTVVTHIDGSQYGVSFVTTDHELFFALVDIESDEVVESSH